MLWIKDITRKSNKRAICTYFSAWKLRGDNPEYYKYSNYSKPNLRTEYDEYSENHYPDDDKILMLHRNNNEIVSLYNRYHFDGGVKLRGAEKETFEISDEYIAIIVQIQKKMRKKISEEGISIECNPSSNQLIGTFRRYDKHPIYSLFNKGLFEKKRCTARTYANKCISEYR